MSSTSSGIAWKLRGDDVDGNDTADSKAAAPGALMGADRTLKTCLCLFPHKSSC